MANITLSIDEDVLKAVQKHAAEEKTSVDALVNNYLTRLVEFDQRAEPRRRMCEMSERAKGGPDEKKWTREELYDR